jgi:hypothetical protein
MNNPLSSPNLLMKFRQVSLHTPSSASKRYNTRSSKYFYSNLGNNNLHRINLFGREVHDSDDNEEQPPRLFGNEGWTRPVVDNAHEDEIIEPAEYDKENVPVTVSTPVAPVSTPLKRTSERTPLSEICVQNMPEYNTNVGAIKKVKASARRLFGPSFSGAGNVLLHASPSTPRFLPTTLHPSRHRIFDRNKLVQQERTPTEKSASPMVLLT